MGALAKIGLVWRRSAALRTIRWSLRDASRSSSSSVAPACATGTGDSPPISVGYSGPGDYETDLEKTSKHWAALKPDRSIWNHPHTGYIMNKRTGDASRDWPSTVRDEFLGGRVFARALSLGCGLGVFDRELCRLGFFKELVGIDVSDAAIQGALHEAASARMPLRYVVGDMNRPFPAAVDGPFDLVYAMGALHHIDNLEALLATVHEHLTDDGVFMFLEYCGPSRFQWREPTLSIANAVLAALPPPLRGDFQRLVPPAYAEFKQSDPSEAIRSAEIMDLARLFFTPFVVKEIGFTLTHAAMNPILRYFDDNNELHQAIVKLIFLFEEILIDQRVLDADTKLVLARKRIT